MLALKSKIKKSTRFEALGLAKKINIKKGGWRDLSQELGF